jgi:hypothetical protein
MLCVVTVHAEKEHEERVAVVDVMSLHVNC